MESLTSIHGRYNQMTQELNILTLSNNMTNSKEDLLAYINFYHYPISDEYQDAKFLINSQEDVNMWIEIWNGDPESIDETNRKLRKWKIEQRLLYGYDEFSDLLMLDEEDFLESYYQQRGCMRTIWELNRVLSEISVRELWQIHREYPYSRVEYLV
jgi:hypothetical protein